VASEVVAKPKLEMLIDEANQLVAILTSIIKTTRKNTNERRSVKTEK